MMTLALPLMLACGGALIHLTIPRLSTLGAYAFAVGLWWTLDLALASARLVHL